MASSEVCLILYHDPRIGIDEAEAALGSNIVARHANVLYFRWDDGPVLRIRALNAVSARDGSVSWHLNLPAPVNQFPRAFEISFDDLEEVLDEINTLIDAQSELEKLTGGACYNSWNENLSLPGDR
jgi:hypothetical protein